MKILHCIPQLTGGGAERQLTYLCEGLVALGHQVDVIVMIDGQNGPRLRRSGARIHLLGWRRPFDPLLLVELAARIATLRPDVVQTWLRRMDVLGGLAARACACPWIYSERSTWTPDGWRDMLRHSLIRGMASAVIANSESGAMHWREVLRPEEVHVVHNIVPLQELAAAPPRTRAELGLPDDAELIVYVGRFEPEKNTVLLGTALAEVLRRRPRGVAYCCGVGLELETLRAMVTQAGVGERCHTPGYRDDIWSLVKSADVLVSASHYEGQPNAVLEAMAAGCPLVLSDIAQHRECAGDDGALYFSTHSKEEAVAQLVAALEDRPAARARAEKTRARVQRLSMHAIASAYAEIYAGLPRRKT
jgi:glycosyltransferase involved in cell wall biosynthesis